MFGAQAPAPVPLRRRELQGSTRAKAITLLPSLAQAIPHNGTTLHSPPFAQAATGSIGIETLLPLALEMYHNKSLPLNKIIEVLTVNPSKILKINKGTLQKGSAADICVVDLDAPWVVKAEKLKSKSKNTAIEDRKLQGKVLMTFLNGELVYSN